MYPTEGILPRGYTMYPTSYAPPLINMPQLEAEAHKAALAFLKLELPNRDISVNEVQIDKVEPRVFYNLQSATLGKQGYVINLSYENIVITFATVDGIKFSQLEHQI